MNSHENKDNHENLTNFPFDIVDVCPAINEKLLQDYKGERTGFIQVGEKKWFFSNKFRHHLEKFYNFEVRPTDVWIVTFPRSGTTLTQEMTWLLLNNLDYERASGVLLNDRFPFLEMNCLFHPDLHAEFLKESEGCEKKYKEVERLVESVYDHLDQLKERRFIKTHLPLSLLPKNLLTSGCKVIYVARNPKDVAVSYYHHNRTFRTRSFSKPFPEFWQYFKNNLVTWGPYWEHIFEGWEKRNEKNLLFLFYENTNKDPRRTISEIQNFFEIQYSEEQLNGLVEHLKIDNFRKNNSVNFDDWKVMGVLNTNESSFIRKGKTGDAKNLFDENIENEANEWIRQHLKNSDLKFPSV